MEAITAYFSDMPTLHRTLLLVGGLTFFFLVEQAVPLFAINYNRKKHTAINIFFTLTTIIVNFAMAGILVWVAIAIKIVGGGAVIIGKRVGVAAGALIVFTLIATLAAHRDIADPMQLTATLKNLSIVGGLLYVMAHGAGSMKVAAPAASTKSM